MLYCKIQLTIFISLNLSIAFSQTIITIDVKGLNGPNGFALDSKNNLYIANEPGKKIVWLKDNKQVPDSINSDSPSGLAFDTAGNLYISNFFSGTLLRVKGHKIDTITKKLDKPSDIKFDKNGNLYVSEYEKGAIQKISIDGSITKFADGFKYPFGLAFDNEGNLFVANNNLGLINKVSTKGVITFFAQVPGSISYITYSEKTKRLFVPCFSNHTIYVISINGDVTLLTGNGVPGYKDGSLKEAQFEGPNSIAISSDGNLFISEFSKNRIRKIINVE